MIVSKIDSEFLRYLLANGHTPGERLPSLNEIGEATGLSVGKLREQFEVARSLGLVEASPRRGIIRMGYDFLPGVRLSLMIALAVDPKNFDAFSSLRAHLETSYWDEAVAVSYTHLDVYKRQQLEDMISQSLLHQTRVAANDSLGLCIFGMSVTNFNQDFMTDAINAAHGVQLTPAFFEALGRDTLRLEREFNRQAGFDVQDDELPAFFYNEALPPTNHVARFHAADLQQMYDLLPE